MKVINVRRVMRIRRRCAWLTSEYILCCLERIILYLSLSISHKKKTHTQTTVYGLNSIIFPNLCCHFVSEKT